MYDFADQRADSVGSDVEPIPSSATLHVFDFGRQPCADAKLPTEQSRTDKASEQMQDAIGFE